MYQMSAFEKNGIYKTVNKATLDENPGRNNGRNFSGVRALTAVTNSHRSRY